MGTVQVAEFTNLAPQQGETELYGSGSLIKGAC
jgi:hypothetical protein